MSDPRGRTVRRYGASVVHPVRLPPEQVVTVDGVRVTNLARTVFDIGRVASFKHAVVVADSALRQGLERADVLTLCDDYASWPGARAARRAALFADARSDAASESLARVVFLEHGLPRPQPQAKITDSEGVVAQVDFLIEEFAVVAEVDGKLKYIEEAGGRAKGDRLWQEKLRQERLEQAGYRVVRFTWQELTTRPAAVVARIQAALDRASAQRAVG